MYDDFDIAPPPLPSSPEQKSVKKGFFGRFFGSKKKSPDEIIASIALASAPVQKTSVDDLQAIRTRLGLDAPARSVDVLREQLEEQKNASVTDDIVQYEKEQSEYEDSVDEHLEPSPEFSSESYSDSSLESLFEPLPKSSLEPITDKTIDAKSVVTNVLPAAFADAPAHNLTDSSATDAVTASDSNATNEWISDDGKDVKEDFSDHSQESLQEHSFEQSPIISTENLPATSSKTSPLISLEKDNVTKTITQPKNQTFKEKKSTKLVDAKQSKQSKQSKKTIQTQQMKKPKLPVVSSDSASETIVKTYDADISVIVQKEQELKKLEEELAKEKQIILNEQKKLAEKEKALRVLAKKEKELAALSKRLDNEKVKKGQQLSKQQEALQAQSLLVKQKEQSVLEKEKQVLAQESTLQKESFVVAKKLRLVEEKQEEYKQRILGLKEQLKDYVEQTKKLAKEKESFASFKTNQESLLLQAKEELDKVRGSLFDRVSGYEGVVREREEEIIVREDSFAEWSPRLEKETTTHKELRVKQEDVLRRLAENELLFKKLSAPPTLLDSTSSTTVVRTKRTGDIASLIEYARALLSQGNVFDAKLAYNDLREKFLAVDCSEFQKNSLSRKIKSLYDDIHLHLLEEQAQKTLYLTR